MKNTRSHDEATWFLNVDVDVYSRTSLQPLMAALGRKVIVHRDGREGREYSAHFSLATAHGETADTVTYRLAGLIQTLPRPLRALWDAARRRDFNLGIQAGTSPFSHEIGISKRTLERVVDVGGRLVITTYAARIPRRRTGGRPRKDPA